jgi:hypothetical protein
MPLSVELSIPPSVAVCIPPSAEPPVPPSAVVETAEPPHASTAVHIRASHARPGPTTPSVAAGMDSDRHTNR